MRKTGKKGLFDGFFFVLFMQVHAAEPVFSRWKLSTHWSKTAHVTIELRSRHRINSRLTRFVSGKANECRWQHRRYQVDPWSRRREVARNVLRSSPQPEKRSIFLHRRGIENLSLVLYTPVDKCFFIRRLAGARQRITGRVANTDQRVGRSP